MSGPRTLELEPGLLCVVADNPGPLTLDGTRTYIVGGSRPAVVDPGPDRKAQRDAVAAAVAGRPVAAVCLTHAHPDHSEAAVAVARALGAPVAASRETLRRLGLEGRALSDGEGVAVDDEEDGLLAVEAPGHSGDHLAWLWSRGRRLFTGDLVLGTGTSVIVHPDGSVGAYLASLARLIALGPRLILPGHGEPVRDPVRRLEEYRAHRLERDRQVLGAVRGGAASVAAVRRAVYGALPGNLEAAAELSVRAHLRHLREEGEPLPAIEGESIEGGTAAIEGESAGGEAPGGARGRGGGG